MFSLRIDKAGVDQPSVELQDFILGGTSVIAAAAVAEQHQSLARAIGL